VYGCSVLFTNPDLLTKEGAMLLTSTRKLRGRRETLALIKTPEKDEGKVLEKEQTCPDG